MSAVSNRVMPRSIALWITLREASRSMRWPKLLQPRPTAETRRPEPPRLRICMDRSCGMVAGGGAYCDPHYLARQAAGLSVIALGSHAAKKRRPRSDAATDGGRLGRVI